jgi:diguanylate cyclase (GGDEF)-like protein
VLHSPAATVLLPVLGVLVTLVVMRAVALGRRLRDARHESVTRVDAYLQPGSPGGGHGVPKFTPAKSTALRRDVQEVYETKEATYDLEVLDRLLRDIRDLSGADEAIFWRWVEPRQTLVPNAWSTEGERRPVHFDKQSWGVLVRWSAEEGAVRLGGDIEGAPMLAAAPVLGVPDIYGVLTLTADAGLGLDREAALSWMPRFAGQVAALLQLFDLRREYGRHMRQSGALLHAVQRLHGHRSAESLAQALCDTAREVTSASVAGLVRWNAAEQHGVVQAIAPSSDVEPGFYVTADSLVGNACIEGRPLLFDDARAATREMCPYGGLPRTIGSAAFHPIVSGDQVIGALVVEGSDVGQIAQHESRNIGLLAAVARGPLESVWEIEEVNQRARTDSLTGLANRRHFDEHLKRVVAETDRFGGSCSLILVDLDHFKAVNDQHGHEAGDAVLRHVGQLLGDAVRTVDLCARYGGEEMGILLPQTSERGAAELADRLRQILESRPSSHAGFQILVTGSFGVATYPSPVPYGDWLVLAADRALYEAKAAGRNCVRVIQSNHVTPALYKMR